MVFFKRLVGAVEGADANGLFGGDLLFGAPDGAFGVGAGDGGLEGHHGFEGSGRIVGGLGGADAGIEKGAEGEHPIEAVRPVLVHLFAVIVDVGGKGCGDDAEAVYAADEAGV